MCTSVLLWVMYLQKPKSSRIHKDLLKIWNGWMGFYWMCKIVGGKHYHLAPLPTKTGISCKELHKLTWLQSIQTTASWENLLIPRQGAFKSNRTPTCCWVQKTVDCSEPEKSNKTTLAKNDTLHYDGFSKLYMKNWGESQNKQLSG